MKILMVEDNVSIVTVTRLVLEREGFVVRSSDDDGCFTIAEEWQPSIILMDVRLPRLDGVEACMQLKLNPRTTHIPVVLMTADQDGAELVQLACADGLLAKPFSNKVLVETVKRTGGLQAGMDGSEVPPGSSGS